MKGVVWYNTSQAGLEKLTEIKNGYVRSGIKVVREGVTTHSVTIYFENGDIWTAVKASENARGRRCNISYIDRSIPRDIVNCIIKPCTMAFPYRAYNYYGDVDFNYENDENDVE